MPVSVKSVSQMSVSQTSVCKMSDALISVGQMSLGQMVFDQKPLTSMKNVKKVELERKKEELFQNVKD